MFSFRFSDRIVVTLNLKQLIAKRLNYIIDNLRMKGDHYRANKVEEFKKKYFANSEKKNDS